MTSLAIDGGEPEVKHQLRPFNTIGESEAAAALDVLRGAPLSGFLGGEKRGGYWVRKLEDEWAAAFGVRHAVACNSATSGLLAAVRAAGHECGERFMVSPFTMSATAAAPTLLGMQPLFGDIESGAFGLDTFPMQARMILITNMFGHPANLAEFRRGCDGNASMVLIEDNAQSPFATEHGRYAGTIGHIGVFSLNVHKHFHAGEGGICVTDDEGLADEMRAFVNHGELSGHRVGLNLRMTEITAAIALAQLRKAEMIIADRVALAESLTSAVKGLPGLTPPVVREGCTHVYYCWALKVTGGKDHVEVDSNGGGWDPRIIHPARDWFVKAMQAEGVPLRAGYVDPLYRLPAFRNYARPCPVAERMHDRELVLWENCAWAPDEAQIQQIGNAFQKVAEHMR